MTHPSRSGQARGLAASIHRLFETEAVASPQEIPLAALPGEEVGGAAGDMAWVAEAGVRLPGDVNRPDPLMRAVRRFLRAGDGDRVDARAALEAAVADARSRRAGPAQADAVEVLCHFRGEVDGALEAAHDMTTPGVATLLVERLVGTHDEERREELSGALPELGEEVGYALVEALRQEALDVDADRSLRRLLLRLLGEMGGRHPDLIREMMDDANWRVVRNAIPLAADMDGAGAIQHLTAALGHDRPEVRREALSALGRVGGDDATALAVGKLGDPDPGVRGQAARSLGILTAERALRPLIQQLEEEPEPSVQVELIRTLGVLGDPSAVLPIEKRISGSLFSRPPLDVRVVGYRALAAIGTPHAMGLIDRALEDRDPEVQKVARTILESRERHG